MKKTVFRVFALFILTSLLMSLCACGFAGGTGSAGKVSLDYEQRAEEINSAAASGGGVSSGFQFGTGGKTEAPQEDPSSGEEAQSGMEAYYSFGTNARESGGQSSGSSGSPSAQESGTGSGTYGGRPGKSQGSSGAEQESAVTETQAPAPSYTQEVEEEVEEQPQQDEQSSSANAHVTITIRCDTAVNNGMHQESKWAGIVPASGCILPVTAVDVQGGETVFDILAAVCDKYKLHMSYRGGTGSGCYVDGINNLYEFDGGRWSGWMYSVNGWYPNYGCGVYFVSAGDVIEWNYTCDLGLDLDSSWWEGAQEWKDTHD